MISKRLIGFMSEAKKYIGFHVFLQLLNLVLNIVAIFVIADLIEKVSTKSFTNNDLILVSSIVVGVVILRYIINIFIAKASHNASGRVKQILRKKIYSKLLALGAKYKEKFTTSYLVQIAMEGVDQLEIYFGRYLPQFFYSMIAPIILFIVLSTISIKASVILLICVPLIPISIVACVKIAKKILGKYWGQYANLGQTFLENIQGLTTLKIYNADERKNDEMNVEAEKFRIATMNLLYMQLNSITIMDVIAYGGAALGIIVAVYEYINGRINLAGTFSIIMLSAEFFIPLRLLGSFFHIAMNGMSASDRMFKILDMDIDNSRTNLIDRNNENIRFENVSFSYDGENSILNNISLDIKEKSFVSIVGQSGCGKSTIASLISLRNEGYYGSIKIGDIELSSISRDDLMKRVVVVDHNSYLFEGSVYDNLLMAGEHISKEDMIKALKQVELYDFLESENGLDTKILERASNFSGGQRQRLALARAILFDADIYIFDEATSNVDVESEESIMNIIKDIAKRKSVILISHRLFNCIDSDNIYFIKNGFIAEEGIHSYLMGLNGEYAKLFNEQYSLETISKGETINA